MWKNKGEKQQIKQKGKKGKIKGKKNPLKGKWDEKRQYKRGKNL